LLNDSFYPPLLFTFTPGDALLLVLTDDQHTQAGKVAQGIERPFGFLLL
jgi:hypothetical protein